MTDQNMKENSKPKSKEELRNAIAEILKDAKKKEMEYFVSSLDPLMAQVDDVLERGEAENKELKLSMFRYKIALITFNGVLLALMVGSKDNISFNLLPFSLLFISIVIGLLQVIIYYFKNDYKFIDGLSIVKKLQAVSELCREKNTDENIINDAKFFLRSFRLQGKKNYDNIPSLLKDIGKKYNVTKLFIKSLVIELLFFVPFIVGIGLVIYRLYLYVS